MDEKFKPGVLKNNFKGQYEHYNLGYLFNGMINPLIPYTIKGAIWYQGENNRPRANNYSKLMQVMVESWRKEWGQGDFPFYFVQIAPFRYDGPDKVSSALLRDHWWLAVQRQPQGESERTARVRGRIEPPAQAGRALRPGK